MTAAIPTLEPAFDVVVRLGPIEDHGMTRVGHRRIVPIVGGTISGGVEAKILPGGADWQIVRADGAIEIDGRYSARTPDGHYLHLHATGVRSGSPEVLDALLRGEAVPSDEYYFRTTVRLETASPAWKSLEHSIFIASCVRTADTVSYTAYRVT